jgi:hypothetical protein
LDVRFRGRDARLVARKETNQSFAGCRQRETVGTKDVALEEVAGEREAGENIGG